MGKSIIRIMLKAMVSARALLVLSMIGFVCMGLIVQAGSSSDGSMSYPYYLQSPGDDLAFALSPVVSDYTSPHTTCTVFPTPVYGWNKGTVDVYLYATDNDGGSGVREIHYSIDGGPEITYTGYSKTVQVSGEGYHYVDYYAVDYANNGENSHHQTLSIDDTAPTTHYSADLPNDDGWNYANVRVTLTASDMSSGVKEIHYSVNGGSIWDTEPGSSASFTLRDEGTHNLQFYAVDNVGNRGDTIYRTVKIDKHRPMSYCDFSQSPNAEGWVKGDTEVTITSYDEVSGIKEIHYSADSSGSHTATSSPVKFTLTAPGRYDIRFSAVDYAGNYEDTQSETLKIDNSPPQTSCYFLPTQTGAGWNNGDVNVYLNANDFDSGVYRLRYRVNSGSWNSIYGPSTTIPVSNHMTTVEYYATDNVYNDEVTNSVTVRIDRTLPTTTISTFGASSNGWYFTNATVDIAYGDTVSGLAGRYYRINNGAWSSYTGPFDISADGTYVIDSKAEDNAGNLNYDQKTVSIDKNAPVVNYLASPAPNAAGWNNGSVLINLTASDGAGSGVNKTGYSTNGLTGAWTYVAGPSVLFTLSNEETYDVWFYATDFCMGTVPNFSNRTIKIDSTVPVTTYLASPAPNAYGWNNGDVQVTLSASDAGSGVKEIWYSTNGGSTWINVTGSSVSFTLSNERIYDLRFYAVDNADNREAVQSQAVRVDKTVPVTIIDVNNNRGENGWHVNDVTVTLTPSDGLSGVGRTWYSVDDVNFWVYEGPFVISQEGLTNITYRSRDNASNYEVMNVTQVFLDKTFPVSSATLTGTMGNDGTYISEVQVTLSRVEANPRYTEYGFDGLSWVDYTVPFNVTEDGMTTVYYRTKDMAGNLEAYQTVSMDLDCTPPEAVETMPDNGYVYASLNGSILITFSEPLDPTNVTDAAVTVSDWYGFDVPGTISYSGNTITFDPAADFGPLFEYGVVVSGTVTDIAGNPMGADYRFTFKATGIPMTPGTFIPGQTLMPSVSPSPSPVPSITPTPGPIVTPTSTPSASPSPSPAPSEGPSSDSSPLYLGMLVLLLGIVAIAGAAIYFTVFRK